MKRLSMVMIAGTTIFALSGCAKSSLDTADIMRAQAKEVQTQADRKNSLADEWERGAKLVKAGENRIREGKKQIKIAEKELKEGKQQVERGKKEVAEGHELMNSSELKFQTDSPEAQPQTDN
jgi:predicted  nucleic acid-binding Zn-ribbon protein